MCFGWLSKVCVGRFLGDWVPLISMSVDERRPVSGYWTSTSRPEVPVREVR